MNDAITPNTIVRLRDDHRVVGLVHEVDGGRAAVVCGPPEGAVGLWVPLYDLELVPWEELGEVPMVLLA